MISSVCLACALLIQLTTAQILSYGVQRNTITSPVLANLGNIRTGNIASSNVALAGAGNIAYPSNVAGVPVSNIGNVATGNAEAASPYGAALTTGSGLANYGNGVATYGNGVANYGNGLANYGNGLANYGNTATFTLNSNGSPFAVTSGSPGNSGFGIQVVADALEVGGTVAVVGQMPIYGTVALNGNVPTDGSATVNYGCGGVAA